MAEDTASLCHKSAQASGPEQPKRNRSALRSLVREQAEALLTNSESLFIILQCSSRNIDGPPSRTCALCVRKNAVAGGLYEATERIFN